MSNYLYRLPKLHDVLIYNKMKTSINTLPAAVKDYYNAVNIGTSSRQTLYTFRANFLYNYDPQVFLAAVIHARMLYIEKVPEPWSRAQQTLHREVQRIIQEVAAYFNNFSRDQGRHLHRIAKIAGYFLLKSPSTDYFVIGLEHSINQMPAFPTQANVDHWRSWATFRNMFSRLDPHGLDSTMAQSMAWGMSLLECCGPASMAWSIVCAPVAIFLNSCGYGYMCDPSLPGYTFIMEPDDQEPAHAAPAQAGPSQPQPRGRSSSRPPGSRSSSRSSGRAGPSRSERRSSSRR